MFWTPSGGDALSRDTRVPEVDPRNETLCKLVELVREEVRRCHGSELTFEQQNDLASEVMCRALSVYATEQAGPGEGGGGKRGGEGRATS